MSELFSVGLQEAEKSTKNKVETVLLDTLYLNLGLKAIIIALENESVSLFQ
jgi:hypothetical protein